MRNEIQRGSRKRGDIGILSVSFDRLITERTTYRIYGLTQWSKINQLHFYEETTTCADPAWVWRPRCWSFCVWKGSAISVHPHSCDPEIQTTWCDGDEPPPRCFASEQSSCYIADFLRRRLWRLIFYENNNAFGHFKFANITSDLIFPNYLNRIFIAHSIDFRIPSRVLTLFR